MVAFDWKSWYGVLAGAAAVYVLWASVFETGRRHLRWAYRKLRPLPSEPNAVPREPVVVIGAPGGSIRLTQANQLAPDEHRRVELFEPRYLIENKDPFAIRDVTTGVRTKDDGREYAFGRFRAPAMTPSTEAWVEKVGSIPRELLEGAHESNPAGAFLWWARFRHAETGLRWEIVCDPETMEHSYRVLEDESSH